MKVAILHDWLDSYRGGEKVLEQILAIYPDAPVYTLFYEKEKLPPSITSRTIYTPALLRPFKKIRKLLLPLFPFIIEFMDFKKYDLIVSTSSCVVKSAKASKPGAKHICYIHSPMRYIWDQIDEYTAAVSHIPGAKFLIHFIAMFLRRWDVKTSSRADRYVVNSSFVGERVKKLYKRSSIVVHPPVDIDRFNISDEKSDYYLVAGAMVSYKRFDLAIEACNALGVKLIVAGSGPMEGQLRKVAGNNVEFIISPSDRQWCDLMSKAKGFIFPGTEDFGITAIEALASGTPIIAYKEGGALDFVTEQTGVFFTEKKPSSLAEAIVNAEKKCFDPKLLRNFSKSFSKSIFIEKFTSQINETLKGDKL